MANFKLDSGSTAANILRGNKGNIGIKKKDNEMGSGKVVQGIVPLSNTVDKEKLLVKEDSKKRKQQNDIHVDFARHEKRDEWFQARVPASVKANIKKYAKKNGISQAAFIIALVDAYARSQED